MINKSFVLLLILIVLSACSTDSGESQPSGFLKRATTYSSTGEILLSRTYYYNGDKIRKILESDGQYSLFFYEGDQISRQEKYTDTDFHWFNAFFEYDSSGRLITYSIQNHRENIMMTVDVTSFTFVGNSVEYFQQVIGSYTITGNFIIDDNGDIVEAHRTYSNGYTQDYLFHYDDQVNPLSLIRGYKEIKFAGEPLLYFSANGNVSMVEVLGNNGGATQYVYTYNSSGLPLTVGYAQSAPGQNSSTTYEYY